MPRGVKKENLPTKICVTCNRPFTWRKKWEKVWDEVSTCSKSCNKKRRQQKNAHKYALKSENAYGEEHDQEYMTTSNSREENEDSFVDVGKNIQSEKHVVDVIDEFMAKDMLDNEKDIDVETDLSFSELIQANNNDISLSGNSSKSEREEEIEDPVARRKALRKAEKKRKKQERRAKREGRGDPTAGQKQCDMCDKHVDLLIRCTYDESLEWKMVCGKCWKTASGGVVDGDASHPYYKYGGLWKNRRRK